MPEFSLPYLWLDLILQKSHVSIVGMTDCYIYVSIPHLERALSHP